jgi:signal transduction histidine kinase
VQPIYVQHQRAERLIAIARTAFALLTLVVLAVDPTVAEGRTRALFVFGVVYAVYSAVVAIIVWRFAVQSLRARVITHVIDIAAYGAILAATQTPVSPFAMLFVFALFCATLRFPLRGLLWTAATLIVMYAAISFANSNVRSDPAFFLTRVTYIAFAALLLTYLRQYQQRMQDDLSNIANWPRTLPREREPLLRDILPAAARLLRASRALLVWEENDEPWLTLAYFDGQEIFIKREGPELRYVNESMGESLGSSTFYCADVRKSSTLIAQDGGAPHSINGCLLDAAIIERFAVRSVLSSPIETDEAHGRFFVFDSRDVTYDDLVLSDIAAQLIATQLDETALFQSMRLAAVSDERLRLARDLHDGLLQSLTAIKLQLERVHHLIRFDAAEAEQSLRRVQELIAHDQQELRAFITQLRPRALAAHALPLPSRLAALAARFRQQWGIDVAVTLLPSYARVSDSVGGELFNLVAESLANAAKHAHATRIDVTVNIVDGVAEIGVEDNGRGFPFHGTYDLAALDAGHRGPVTLRERVASLRGSMLLHSSAQGARIEMKIPI